MRSHGTPGVERQQRVLQWVYSTDQPGVSVIDTREHTVGEVARMIASIIHRGVYKEFSFNERLGEIEAGAQPT